VDAAFRLANRLHLQQRFAWSLQGFCEQGCGNSPTHPQCRVQMDMSVFQNVLQAAFWAGVSPGNHESAGKRKSSRIPKGNAYLTTALVEAANAATKAKGTYLRDKFTVSKLGAGTSAQS